MSADQQYELGTGFLELVLEDRIVFFIDRRKDIREANFKYDFVQRDQKVLLKDGGIYYINNKKALFKLLNPDQKKKVSRSKLIEHGFDFNYFTSIYTTKAGAIYYFVYDQGYLPLEGDYYALVKRES